MAQLPPENSNQRADAADHSSRESGSRALLLWVLLSAAALTSAAWAVGILYRAYDYDEVLRAHSIWLTTQGLRPYHDFFECHPPYFRLLAPLANWCGDPGWLLTALRVVSAVGMLLFAGGILANIWLSEPQHRLAGAAALLLVAMHPAVLGFMVEFRVDGWGYAVLVWSIWRFRKSTGKRFRHLELAFLTSLTSLLICPKITLLPPIIVLADWLSRERSLHAAGRIAGMCLVGIALAIGVFLLYLFANDIGLEAFITLGLRYHLDFSKTNSFGYGLLISIAWVTFLLMLVSIGVGYWLFNTIRKRAAPDCFVVSLLVFLLIQACIVSYPHKQYYAPWFLLASVFVVFPMRHLTTTSSRCGALIIACLVGWMVYGESRSVHRWLTASTAKRDLSWMRLMNQIALPDDTIVALPPYHPVYRRGTFYVGFNTYDPTGHGSERLLRGLPLVAAYAKQSYYTKELENRPPAFIVWGGTNALVLYPIGQRETLSRFLQERDYRLFLLGKLHLAVRPDRVARCLELGLTEMHR